MQPDKRDRELEYAGDLPEEVRKKLRSAIELARFVRLDPVLYGGKNTRHELWKTAYGTHTQCTGGEHASG
jgi:hypothetical protein